MSDLNSWEDDPAAQDDNLSRQTQQMNLNRSPATAPTFRPGAASFQPTAHSFQPGQQAYGGYNQYQQPQQGYYGGQNYYPPYGQQGAHNQQYGQGYGNIYGQQGGYGNQGYGEAQPQFQPQSQPSYRRGPSRLTPGKANSSTPSTISSLNNPSRPRLRPLLLSRSAPTNPLPLPRT